MAFEISKLELRIRAILQSPGIDLATISAKRVRKRLIEEDPGLTSDVVKENKEDIDRVIATVYEEVSAEQQAEAEAADEDRGEEEEEAEDQDDTAEVASTSKPAKKRKRSRKTGSELSDAELARQLSSELNGLPRSAKKATPSKKRGTKRKSAEVVDSDGEGDGERPKKRGGGFSKEYTLSEPLAALLSVEKMSRPQVVKHLWIRIKGQSLQNPKDKREIICDEGMRAVFGVDKINMFAMNKMLGQHLYEPTP
ncbi:hypothetical protein EUX98_g1160 [Antrodiella citrinella]|uniref:DM2 domain-containing protein n=1 Tax=Antrodiella citrinella TaxID=2447956 RepID=A0A4S4NAY9_9APHY|nr:hypothetical protein EUX98_g1160 [Antrodiella citrinella]